MLPVEGTDVHVSRCGSISSGEKKKEFKHKQILCTSRGGQRYHFQLTAVNGWGARREGLALFPYSLLKSPTFFSSIIHRVRYKGGRIWQYISMYPQGFKKRDFGSFWVFETSGSSLKWALSQTAGFFSFSSLAVDLRSIHLKMIEGLGY